MGSFYKKLIFLAIYDERENKKIWLLWSVFYLTENIQEQ